jgi:hypothetical protein
MVRSATPEGRWSIWPKLTDLGSGDPQSKKLWTKNSQNKYVRHIATGPIY